MALNYLFFSNCIPVKGYINSNVCDLQNMDYKVVPNHFLEVLINNDQESRNQKFKEYFVDLGLGFFTDEQTNFPSLNLLWESPFSITNIQIDLRNVNKLNSTSRVKSILKLQIPNVQILLNASSKIDFSILNNDFDNSCTNYLELILEGRYCKINYESLKHLLNIQVVKKPKLQKEYFILENKNIVMSLTHFTESQKHNTYFNRKLYIGANGEIKNAPECSDWFGFIQNVGSVEELKEIISMPKFQKYWFVHKELIDVCKDCEFRHTCIDNRVPKQRSKNEWYHETECNYNPYIAKWKGEKGYKTLDECEITSNEKYFNLIPDKIASINKILQEN